MDIQTIREFLQDSVGENLFVEDDEHIEQIIDEYKSRKMNFSVDYEKVKSKIDSLKIDIALRKLTDIEEHTAWAFIKALQYSIGEIKNLPYENK